MRTAAWVAGVAVAVAGAAGGGWWWAKVRPMTRVQDLVREQLIDPESARFRSVAFAKEGGAACGFVNSRNRLGGMAGATAFLVQPGGEVKLEPDRGMPESLTWLREAIPSCRGAKVFWDDYHRGVAP